jgi:hypothetical protein
MKIVDHNQTWKGFYTYSYDDGYTNQDVEVTFIMELTFNDNSFEGISNNTETENLFTEPTLVKGFIQDNIISFTLNYPCVYYKDENGNIQLDEDSQNHIVEYFGYYDEDEKKFSGTWEIIVSEEKISEDDYIQEVAYGEFEIQRIK